MEEPHNDSVQRRWIESACLGVPFRKPESLAAWSVEREVLRRDIRALLGRLPPRTEVSRFRTMSRSDRGDYFLERFEFENGAGSTVPGYLLLPKGFHSSVPAILYCHWHAGQYDLGKEEVLANAHMPEVPGPALARLGFAVMAIDAGGFGERNGSGPGGPGERGRDAEETACKFHLWSGRSFWGMVVHDDLTALDYLASRPEIDPNRIGVTGISMGSTRSWWLMAMDERIRTGVCVACLTRYRNLAERGLLREHHMGYFVPGMLARFDAESVVSLIAPRPVLFQNGDSDPGSPVEGIREVEEAVRPVYALYGREADFESRITLGQGHVYTRPMWQLTLDWFARRLA
jgi:dienelactone hydrolase